MELLLAGPGTGKTTRIKQILTEDRPENVLVLSFTNATINDLHGSFRGTDLGVNERNCMTLHKYSLLLNHLLDFQVIDDYEDKLLQGVAQRASVPIDYVHTTLRCITFQKMIDDCAAYIDTNPLYAQEKIGDLDLLIVDEFQDFNASERNLIYKIAELAKRTIILGDDDQSIYDFKDADASELIAMHNNDDVAKLQHENKCYRCPDEVVEAATKLITKNKLRVAKQWQPSGKDGYCVFEQLADQDATLKHVCDTIAKIKAEAKDESPRFMVLAPVGFATEGLAECLKDAGITAKNWFANKIAADSLMLSAYLKFILSNHRLLNLLVYASHLDLSAHRRAKLNKIVSEALQNFDEQAVLTSLASANIFDDQANADIIAPPDLDTLLGREEFSEFRDYFEGATDSDSIRAVLQRLNVLIRAKEASGQDGAEVDIMSIHRSKGLQSDYVFILGLVNGICPNKNKGLNSYEAQRRLLFVGMSRAKRGLHCISTVQWNGSHVNRVDKSQFKYSPRHKKYLASTSDFIKEIVSG